VVSADIVVEKIKRQKRAGKIFFHPFLIAGKRQESHVPCPFKGPGHDALVLGASACLGGGKYFGMRRHKAPEKLCILIIYSRDFFQTEQARFFLDSIGRHG
jgi:hypothetical protein